MLCCEGSHSNTCQCSAININIWSLVVCVYSVTASLPLIVRVKPAPAQTAVAGERVKPKVFSKQNAQNIFTRRLDALNIS